MARSPQFRRLITVFRKAHNANLQANQHSGLSPSRLTRRRWLKLSAMAAGAALSAPLRSQLAAAEHSPLPKVAIVGGGIAGLNAAYQLKKYGILATVYEAKPRVGGRIYSISNAVKDGFINDLGGSFINTDHADMLMLVDEFNLELFDRDAAIAASPILETAYFFEGIQHSEADVAEMLRPLASQIAVDAGLLDEHFDHYSPQFDQQSAAQYLDLHASKIPVSWIRTLIELSIRSEFGVEAKTCSALELLANLPSVEENEATVINSDEAFSVVGGSGKLIESLASALEGQIQLEKSLARLESKGSGYRLTFQDGSSVDAEFVILAIPFPVLRQIEMQVGLPATLRQFIQELDLGKNEKIQAGFHDRVWQQESGFVSSAWSDLGFCQLWEDTLGQTETQARNTGGVLTFYFGGDEVTAAQSTSARGQGRAAVEALEAMIPGVKGAMSDRFLRTAWTTDPFAQGSYSSYKPGQYTAFSDYLYIESSDPDEAQDVAVGNLVFAGEHLSDEFYGYMNGAAQTGRLAAATVVRLAHVRSRQ